MGRLPSLTDPESFVFLNRQGLLSEIGWDGPEPEKLWRYNQHYFDDLNARDAPARLEWHHALLADWVARNPPGKGTGWEPYPTSLRIVNWVKWALAGNELPPECHQSLAVQARWLSRRLEWHLLGNHLLANAKALVFAALYFDGPEAEKWLARGTAILHRELGEQVLPDGGHFELSPMYHALALEDMLDLLNILDANAGALPPTADALRDRIRERSPAMQRWLHAMSHPDGGIAFFNDAAFGIAPAAAGLDDYAGRLGLAPARPPDPDPVVELPDSGYARLARGPAVLIADLARVGPDYLPGHAHADTLSFELSLHGHRVLVNSGTSVYGDGRERLRQRGTAAHNTVVVAGSDSSEVWSGFRVARRARPLQVRVADEGGRLIAEGAHDGYRRLPGRPVHRRRWTLTERHLEIADEVTPAAPAEARFHLHPAVEIVREGAFHGHLRLPGGETVRWRAEAAAIGVDAATWHPEFGSSIANECLVLTLAGGRATLHLSWE